jgi:hypothetical protein
MLDGSVVLTTGAMVGLLKNIGPLFGVEVPKIGGGCPAASLNK